MKKNKDRPQTSAPPKISQRICQVAGDFIRVGEALEDRQNRLNAACSAWNMACNTPELRKKHLDQYIQGYAEFNPKDVEALADVRRDMETLIELKLKMFPHDLRQVVEARITREGDGERVDVVAARLP